jgi:hypothetical protein
MNSDSKTMRPRRPKWKPQFPRPLFPPQSFTVEELDAALEQLMAARKQKTTRHAAPAAN